METTPLTTTLKLGFLGPGAMGTGMISRLQSHGHTVNVFARNPQKISELLAGGATFYPHPVQLVLDSDVVLGCLLDTAVIREIYLGSDGIAQHAREGQIFVEHATFAPALAQEISEALEARGAHFIDAPVSGGPVGAAQGTLVTMLGGQAQTVQDIRPILGMYCARIKHVGAIGAGLRLKLINQLLVSVHAVAAAEASALVLENGIDPTIAHEALMGGWAASTMLDIQLPKACASEFESDGAAIGGLIEVQNLVADFCAESNFSSRLLGPVKDVFAQAVADGHEASALSALVTQFPTAQQAPLNAGTGKE
ncbi:NAD(P)-dependent oxidoreductase [Arthrobacter sp. MYb227]|uniref:NAD(P)-dependent oxidoreductase n=1 Tax=Arthrobacter sp. MYb227 TaxID=1848601 RepID=UPI0011B07D00|nr:NAD(P)-dependent oxidoreductase [Arthrobacter sp. MYb227]